MWKILRFGELSVVLALVTLGGCAKGRVSEIPQMKAGTFVLRWEGVCGQPMEWKWFCYEIDNEQGRGAVRQWIAANYEAIQNPKMVVPLKVTPAKQLYWLPSCSPSDSADTPGFLNQVEARETKSGVGPSIPQSAFDTRWELWLYVPQGPVDALLSKFELLDRDWVENLPFEQFERLKAIFRTYGKGIDPERPDVRAVLGSTRSTPSTLFCSGTYVLALRRDPESDWTDSKAWTCYRIDHETGRKAVGNWIAANYEALKCSSRPMPVLPTQRLYWFNDETYVGVELMTAIHVGKLGTPEEMMYVENLPNHEFETLKRLFREYGKVAEFDLRKMKANRMEAGLVE
jgi:hypothetical protein